MQLIGVSGSVSASPVSLSPSFCFCFLSLWAKEKSNRGREATDATYIRPEFSFSLHLKSHRVRLSGQVRQVYRFSARLVDAFPSSCFLERLLLHPPPTSLVHLHFFSWPSTSAAQWSKLLLLTEKQIEVHSCPFSSHHCLVAFPRFDPALSRCPLASSVHSTVSEETGGAALPGVEGLRRPDPHPGRDAYEQ